MVNRIYYRLIYRMGWLGFICLFVAAVVLAFYRPVAAQTPPATPDPAEMLPQLESTIAAQEARLQVLESEWEAVRDRGELAVEQALWRQVWLPSILVIGLLGMIGFLGWKSRGDIKKEIEDFGIRQKLQVEGLNMEFDRRGEILEDRFAERLEAAVDFALATLDNRMLPIRLPAGHNLGDLFKTFNACGFENLSWYDLLDETPFHGVTVVFVNSETLAFRFRATLQKMEGKINPRECAFLLYAPNFRIDGDLLRQMQHVSPNLSYADFPMSATNNVITVARGFKKSIRSGRTADLT